MCSSFLNTVFQNIYAFFIGHRVGLVSLGLFTQADKWSKMGIMSLSQVLTSSFLPVLSRYQDNLSQFARVTAKMNRLSAYLLFPCVGFAAVMATGIFHCLFGTKWDAAIILFQMLMIRGAFTVLTSLYSNYILARGRSRLLVVTELLRDGFALAGILVTLPYIALQPEGNITLGIEIFLGGQIVASFITWVATLILTVRVSGSKVRGFLYDLLPYIALTLPTMAVMAWLSQLIANPWALTAAQGIVGAALYMGVCRLLGSEMQREALTYITGRFRRKKA